MFSISLFQISYFTTIQIKLMLCPGAIHNLCFLLTFINILKYFNVTRLPLFTPISLTNVTLLSKNYLHCTCLQDQSFGNLWKKKREVLILNNLHRQSCCHSRNPSRIQSFQSLHNPVEHLPSIFHIRIRPVWWLTLMVCHCHQTQLWLNETRTVFYMTLTVNKTS